MPAAWPSTATRRERWLFRHWNNAADVLCADSASDSGACIAKRESSCYTRTLAESSNEEKWIREMKRKFDLVTAGVVCADVMVRPVESLPDPGTLALVPRLEMHLGGLAGVTAIVYSQLKGEKEAAAYMGRVGRDSFGDFLLANLREEGVNVDHVQRDGSCRSSATVVLISEAGERTFLHHLGTNAVINESDMDLDIIGAARVFHWGGPAITPQLDGAPMGRILERVREQGVKTSMDTCYDGNGVWLPLIEPSLPHLDIVFSSFEEACHYTGKDTPEAIADFYLAYGPETAVIKLGAEGLYAKNRDNEACRIPAHRADVVDTTGAGDASCGGFLYGYLADWEFGRCCRLANAVGGLTVQHMGGAEARTSLEETLQFMESQQ
jgi:sugar/nucleoside kinase (ribokinase family)